MALVRNSARALTRARLPALIRYRTWNTHICLARNMLYRAWRTDVTKILLPNSGGVLLNHFNSTLRIDGKRQKVMNADTKI